MKINHNMSAVIANKQLLRTENGLTSSLERLSSGLRINHASDDAAGMAIASKMNAQIKGLNQASRNASDGVSVLDTADGALNEVASMLQRMRELSVQAANETNTETDLKAIQAEITSLTDEIDRVSKDTEYNTMNLLDGTQDTRVYPNVRGIERIDISDNVEKGVYSITVNAPAEHAVGEGNTAAATTTVTAAQEGKVVINGVEVEINEGDTFTQVYEKLRAGAETGNVNLLVVADTTATGGTAENAGYVPTDVAAGGTLVFVSKQYGSAAELNISCENTALAAYLGIPANGYTEHGADADVSFAAGDNGFTTQATMTTEGTHVKVTDRSGFEMNFEVMPDVAGDVSLEVTDIGTMTLQIGANENQTMDVRIPEISSKSLYIDQVDVRTVNGAGRAITSFDNAIGKVSEARSRIGAYQNRLDSAVNSLEGTEENMTAALSRIEDVDMAEEMSEYTKYNVLSQAATSVLAQANDIPQQVLQLLQ
ncbi:flagellin N-terminal helical domain-containing protein [Roseburia sp. MSJ-14]|uniref:flagellin N-terminal helical domain-containing protein n=1 Tax=Roseburia sp. MSJ-14 TaxID=2841514 RepID=UPI001C0FCEBE|nr:flagellin [Roseburia sp. MSJ-14]MBU5473614.1 flagellin [Roseburia sp. MSJ-14]